MTRRLERAAFRFAVPSETAITSAAANTLKGKIRGQGVREFYSEHFINQIPKDARVTPLSRTIGKDQVAEKFILSFTHNTQWDYLLPVELPHVVVMKF